MLAEDEQYFLHQSLSTPCLNVLEGAEGPYIVDRQGRKLLDFHGNNVHHIGYGHPKLIEAISQQMQTLSFAPRSASRYALIASSGCSAPSSAQNDAKVAAVVREAAEAVVGKRNVEGGPRASNFEHSGFRIVTGLKGAINDDWDVLLQHTALYADQAGCT